MENEDELDQTFEPLPDEALPKKFVSKKEQMSAAQPVQSSAPSTQGKSSRIYDVEDDPRYRLYSQMMENRKAQDAGFMRDMQEAGQHKALNEFGALLSQSASKMGTLGGKRSEGANFEPMIKSIYEDEVLPAQTGMKLREMSDNYDLKKQALYEKLMQNRQREATAQQAMGFKEKQLQLQQDQLEETKRSNRAKEGREDKKLEKSAGLKRLSADEIMKWGSGREMTRIVDDLEKSMESFKQSFGPVVGSFRTWNKYDTMGQFLQSDLEKARQIIGKYYEGGVLRKEDEEKYIRMLPSASDTWQVAKYKLDKLRKELTQKHADNVAALQAQGYDISGLQSPAQAQQQAGPQATAGRKLTRQEYNPNLNKTRKYYDNGEMVELEGNQTE